MAQRVKSNSYEVTSSNYQQVVKDALEENYPGAATWIEEKEIRVSSMGRSLLPTKLRLSHNWHVTHDFSTKKNPLGDTRYFTAHDLAFWPDFQSRVETGLSKAEVEKVEELEALLERVFVKKTPPKERWYSGGQYPLGMKPNGTQGIYLGLSVVIEPDLFSREALERLGDALNGLGIGNTIKEQLKPEVTE